MAKLCYIDTETGSLDRVLGALLQIAAIIEIDGHVVAARVWWLKPDPEAQVTAKSLEIAKQDWSTLQAPWRHDPAIAFKQFEDWLARFVNRYDKADKLVFTGFNSRYDEDVIRSWFLRNNNRFYGSMFWTPSLDIMTIAMQGALNIRHKFENFQLGTVLKAWGLADAEDYPIDAEGQRYSVNPAQLHDARTDICGSRRLYQLLTSGNRVEPVQFEWIPPEGYTNDHLAASLTT